jgi:Tol biopolymer transport system component
MGGTFSHYRLLAPLGEGGMGIVYRAEDTTLGRPVAVKFLHSRTIEDQALRTRFLREARLAASINHPNICTIYEVGEVTGDIPLFAGARSEVVPAGTPFIAMELVVGETLHDRLMRVGRLPVKELLAIGVQIAEGMQEAHARRIVHRDLKPHNVLIDGAGRVKILDFGLAKPLDGPRPDDVVMVDALTRSAELTRMGGIVGTVAYMSPEQAQGKPLDSSSDLFSFGVMLYELATGQRPFDGSSPTSTIAKILETDPRPIRETVPHLPSDLDRIVRRCLQKNPADRYHDARDLVLDLKDLQQTLSSGIGAAVGASSQRPHRSTIALVAGVASVVGLAVAFVLMRGRSAPPVIPATHRQITFSGNVSAPAISPDGKFIAYAMGPDSAQRVVVQDLAGGQPLDVYMGRYVRAVTWSPDGSELAFGAGTSPSLFEAALMIVPRLGGTPRRLNAPSRLIAWSPDGARIASAATTTNSISITAKATGEMTQIRLGGSFAFVSGLHWDPSGRRLAFTTAGGGEESTLWVIGVDGTGQRQVLEQQSIISSPRWSGSGDAIYFVKATQGRTELWKVAVDEDQRTAGGAHPVLAGLPLGGAFTIARDGTQLAYTRMAANSNLWLVTIDSRSTASPARIAQLTSGTLSDTHPAISPDGTRVAFSRRTGDKTDIFSVPIDGGPPQQMTFVANAGSPSWSPDGNKVAFISIEGGKPRIWSASTAGGPPQVFPKTEASGLTDRENAPIAWGAKGTILYQRPGNRIFHVLDPSTEREVALARDGSASWMFSATYSPDETRVAVYWNRPPERGIWILSPATGAEHKIYDGYVFPAGWSADGGSVYALELSNSNSARLLSLPASGGNARVLADLPWAPDGLNCATRDGRRFVCAVPQSTSDAWIAQHFDPEAR